MEHKLETNGFFENFIGLNKISRLQRWQFHPGMLFASNEKWWTSGWRLTIHEGIDILLYLDKNGNACRLGPGIIIPAAADGEVVSVFDDFIGQSICLKHEIYEDSGSTQLVTVYAHTLANSKMVKGCLLKAGEEIGAIADNSGHKSGISSHLHLTSMWVSTSFSFNNFNWNTIYTSKDIRLINPLPLIGCQSFEIMDKGYV